MRVGFGTWRLLYTGIALLGIGIAFIVMISGEMADYAKKGADYSTDRKSTRLNSSHIEESRMPSSA